MLQARDLPLLPVFEAVVRHGSFTAAARALGVAKSVVSENVKALEGRCAAQLLDRSTRQLRLTEAGAVALVSARAIEEAVRVLDEQLDQQKERPTGVLRVATTHDLGALLVAPATGRLVQRYSGLRVEIEADDSPQDLIQGRFDLAIRLGTPRDSAYILRRLAVFGEPILAAPVLADELAHATRPSDLRGAPWVRHPFVSGEVIHFVGPRGRRESVPLTVRAQANSGVGVRALILAGAGVGVLPDYQVRDDLRRGALVLLCPGWVRKQLSLFALLPSGRHPRRAVTLLLEAIQEEVQRLAK